MLKHASLSVTPPGETPAERWLDVPGYEGIYEVSDAGRIRSVPRVTAQGRIVVGKILSQFPNQRGRLMVTLQRDGAKHTQLVHRLVLKTFVGPCPAGMEACHNDSDRTNNALSNLRWDTPNNNWADRRALHAVRAADLEPVQPNKAHYRSQQTHCKRGHLLEQPNLLASKLKLNQRGCLACSRAHSNVRRFKQNGVELDLAAEADRQYAVLLAESDEAAS
jgi:hypothetical protein